MRTICLADKHEINLGASIMADFTHWLLEQFVEHDLPLLSLALNK
jgi:hypothetical protein